MSSEPEITSRKGKKVWTTLVTKPEYVAGLLTVNYTLQSVSAYPLVVMATNTLPESSRATIRSQGMEIIDVEHLAPAAGRHGGFDPKFSRFADTWTKLRVFDLVGYERVVMIDSDMIFLRGMDELFDMDLEDDWIAACPACVCNPFKIPHYPADWVPDNCQYAKQSRHCTIADIPNPKVDDPRTSHLLNSGLVVCKPSKDLMNGIEEYLNTSPTIPHLKFPDQDLLADYFKGRWKVLPWWCNALKTLRAVHQDIWADEEVRLIHFILEKPWNEPPPELYLQTIAYGEVDPSKQQLNYLPPTPVSATSFQQEKQQLRPLPPALLDLVKSTPAQKGITNYDDVHAWWWIAYDKVLEGLKQGLEAPWKEVDSFVHRR